MFMYLFQTGTDTGLLEKEKIPVAQNRTRMGFQTCHTS